MQDRKLIIKVIIALQFLTYFLYMFAGQVSILYRIIATQFKPWSGKLACLLKVNHFYLSLIFEIIARSLSTYV